MNSFIKNLLNFVPEQHGEQGVDAAIHGAIDENQAIHEVFCNPPGGSWTEFDIINPSDGTVSRWDHIPRNPAGVKRPDQVFQYPNEDSIELLTIESKYDMDDLTSDIGNRLIEYFEGNDNYTGLRERPCWHKRDTNGNWEVVEEDAAEEERYWFRDHQNVKYWSGFMFANSPLDLTTEREIDKSLRKILSESDVDVAISISWVEEHQYPQLVMKGTNSFNKSAISIALQKILEAHNSSIKTP